MGDHAVQLENGYRNYKIAREIGNTVVGKLYKVALESGESRLEELEGYLRETKNASILGIYLARKLEGLKLSQSLFYRGFSEADPLFADALDSMHAMGVPAGLEWKLYEKRVLYIMNWRREKFLSENSGRIKMLREGTQALETLMKQRVPDYGKFLEIKSLP